MNIRWNGTASMELESAGKKIFFDVFLPLKGSETKIDIKHFDNVSDIFITHGHFDHIASMPAIYNRNKDVKIYCTETPYTTLRSKGIPEKNLELLAFNMDIRVKGFSLRTFHGKHAILPKATPKRIFGGIFSKNLINLPYILRENRICIENDETVFYQIEAEGKRISLMGSLNLREDVEYPTQSDLLILPYNGWDDNFEPAVCVIERLKPKKVLLNHFDNTFPPVTTEIDRKPLHEKYGKLVMEITTCISVKL